MGNNNTNTLKGISTSIKNMGLRFVEELCKEIKKELIQQLASHSSNVEGSIDTKTLSKYVTYTKPRLYKTVIISKVYIDTTKLQESEEKDAKFDLKGRIEEWSRYKFTFDGINGDKGDNKIDGKYIAWHMVNWLEEGNTIDHKVGNQPIQAQHIFRNTHQAITLRWEEIIQTATIKAKAKKLAPFISIKPPILIEADISRVIEE